MDAALSEWFQPSPGINATSDEGVYASSRIKNKRKRGDCQEQPSCVNDVSQVLNTYFQVNAPFNVAWFHGQYYLSLIMCLPWLLWNGFTEYRLLWFLLFIEPLSLISYQLCIIIYEYFYVYHRIIIAIWYLTCWYQLKGSKFNFDLWQKWLLLHVYIFVYLLCSW